MKVAIGVMGSSSGEITEDVRKKAYELGAAIARRGCILVTGACPGLPHDAARGCAEQGGMTVGISPALGREEHIERYKSPVDHYDVLIYTGSGLMGREVTSIRSCDVVVIIGGRSGTLGEFAIAYDEGRLIGIVEGSGGISDEIRHIVRIVSKETGAVIFYDPDPQTLLDRLLAYHRGNPGRRIREQEA